MTQDILFIREGRAGRIRLNRPKAIHALTKDMCSAMIAALVEWRADPSVEIVLIDHADGRGFCAGGDVRMLGESGSRDGADARAFFHEEYRLNHLLFTSVKPIVAFMDGITMGGGVGISQPAKYRVATENTRFAMPETAIGLFPDVGGGWYLSRLFAGFNLLRHMLRALAPSVPAVVVVLAVRVVEGGERTLGLALGELALYAAVTALATWAFERDLLREVSGYLRRGRPSAARPSPAPAP